MKYIIMKKIQLLSILLLSVSIFFTSCSKDEYVNMAREYTLPLPLSSFKHDTSNNSYWIDATNYLSSSARLDGAVLVFLVSQAQNGSFADALPFQDYFNTGTAFNQHSYSVATGATFGTKSLFVMIRNSTGGQPYQTMSGTLTYKVITIPESAMVYSKGASVDFSNYEQVKKFYKL